MHRRLLLLFVALTLGFTACGSDAEPLSEKAFQTEANKICSVGSDEADELTEELGQSFESGEEPSEDELRDALGKFLDNVEKQIDDIEALDEPGDLESDVEDALAEARKAIDNLREQIEDDPTELLSSSEDPFAAVNEKMNDLGLDECGDES